MPDLNRRQVIAAAGALSISPSLLAAAPLENWQISPPESLGFAAGLEEKLDAGIRSGLLRGLHSVLAARSGKPFLERYYEGRDEEWGNDLGVVAFDAETLHDLRSVTKSVVSLLYGIALDRYLVPPPEAPLMAQFPEYADLAADPARDAIKIEHVLTMSMGIEWNEWGIPYTDPRNAEIMMERAPDRYRFVLERPIQEPPGTRWTYNGGCPPLLARLIEKGAGKTLADFAAEALFAPLGISTFGWARGRDGVHSAASGLRLRPRDLMRIGQMVLARGQWNGRRIVSRDWLEASFRPAIATGEGLDYGRLWWLGEAKVPALNGPQRWIAGFGNGGQRLWLMPSAELCSVMMGGNYNQRDAWVSPTRIWREILLANLHKV